MENRKRLVVSEIMQLLQVSGAYFASAPWWPAMGLRYRTGKVSLRGALAE
jgi:hypothetical protein